MYGVNIANISLTFWLKKYFDIFLQKNFFGHLRKAVREQPETLRAADLSFRNAEKQSTRGLTDTRRCLHIVLNVSGLLMSFNVQWKSPCLFCLFPSFSVSLSCRIYPCRIATVLQPDIAKINTYFEKSTTFCNKKYNRPPFGRAIYCKLLLFYVNGVDCALKVSFFRRKMPANRNG